MLLFQLIILTLAILIIFFQQSLAYPNLDFQTDNADLYLKTITSGQWQQTLTTIESIVIAFAVIIFIPIVIKIYTRRKKKSQVKELFKFLMLGVGVCLLLIIIPIYQFNSMALLKNDSVPVPPGIQHLYRHGSVASESFTKGEFIDLSWPEAKTYEQKLAAINSIISFYHQLSFSNSNDDVAKNIDSCQAQFNTNLKDYKALYDLENKPTVPSKNSGVIQWADGTSGFIYTDMAKTECIFDLPGKSQRSINIKIYLDSALIEYHPDY